MRKETWGQVFYIFSAPFHKIKIIAKKCLIQEDLILIKIKQLFYIFAKYPKVNNNK